MPCRLRLIYRCSSRTTGKFLPDHTALHPTRHHLHSHCCQILTSHATEVICQFCSDDPSIILSITSRILIWHNCSFIHAEHTEVSLTAFITYKYMSCDI
jgi:hypothetical protein